MAQQHVDEVFQGSSQRVGGSGDHASGPFREGGERLRVDQQHGVVFDEADAGGQFFGAGSASEHYFEGGGCEAGDQ